MQRTRLLLAVLVAAGIQALAGCAAWQTRNWDLSQLRDPRASELDTRLAARPEPVVQAFTAPAEDDSSSGSGTNDPGARNEPPATGGQTSGGLVR